MRNDPGLRNTRYIDAFSLMQAIVILSSRLEDAVTFAHFGWMTIFPDLTEGESEVLTTKLKSVDKQANISQDLSCVTKIWMIFVLVCVV